MGWYKMIHIPTGEVILDTRYKDLDGETLSFISQLETIRAQHSSDAVLAARLTGLIDAAIDRGLEEAQGEFGRAMRGLLRDLGALDAAEAKKKEGA